MQAASEAHPGIAPPVAGHDRAVAERLLQLASAGPLSPGTVALCVAAVAAWKDEPAWLRVALQLAPHHGVNRTTLRQVGVVVGLARGSCAERRYLAGLAQQFPSVVTMATVEEADDFDGFDAARYFERHFGAVPERVALLQQLLPEEFATYGRLHAAALHSSALSTKAAELVLCALNASDFQRDFLEIHVAGARRAGASEGEIAQAGYAATPFAGIAAWPAMAAAIVATRPPAPV